MNKLTRNLFIVSVSVILVIVMLLPGCNQKPQEPEPTAPPAKISPEPGPPMEPQIWKKVTLEEASKIWGVKVPVPEYLPPGYEIKAVYIKGHGVALCISDEDIPLQDSGAIDFGKFKITIGINFYRTGTIGGLKLPGGIGITIGGKQGRLFDKGSENSILWQVDIYQDGQKGFELNLIAVKNIPVAELVKVAESFVF